MSLNSGGPFLYGTIIISQSTSGWCNILSSATCSYLRDPIKSYKNSVQRENNVFFFLILYVLPANSFQICLLIFMKAFNKYLFCMWLDSDFCVFKDMLLNFPPS